MGPPGPAGDAGKSSNLGGNIGCESELGLTWTRGYKTYSCSTKLSMNKLCWLGIMLINVSIVTFISNLCEFESKTNIVII